MNALNEMVSATGFAEKNLVAQSLHAKRAETGSAKAMGIVLLFAQLLVQMEHTTMRCKITEVFLHNGMSIYCELVHHIHIL